MLLCTTAILGSLLNLPLLLAMCEIPIYEWKAGHTSRVGGDLRTRNGMINSSRPPLDAGAAHPTHSCPLASDHAGNCEAGIFNARSIRAVTVETVAHRAGCTTARVNNIGRPIYQFGRREDDGLVNF